MSTAASLTAAQRRRFNLVRDRRIVAEFETSEDAHKTARLLYKDGNYSIEEFQLPPRKSTVVHLPGDLEELKALVYSPSKKPDMVVEDRGGGITQSEEVERNYEAFQARIDEYMKEREGEVALLHNREVVEFFDTSADAYRAGLLIYGNHIDGGRFSTQEVTKRVIWMPHYVQLAGQ